MRIDFRGAVFDADGVLLDSMVIWRDTGERYLRGLGLEPEEGLAARLWPLSFEQGCEYLKEHYALEESAREIRDGIFRMIEAFYRNEVQLKLGVREFLARLKAEGIPMTIATAGDRELLTAALKRNHINEYFSAIFTCGELSTDKHHPEIFTTCADFMGLAPENVAVFEDSLYCLETAKRAGFIVIGIEDKYSSHNKESIIEISDCYIADWREIEIEDSINDCRK